VTIPKPARGSIRQLLPGEFEIILDKPHPTSGKRVITRHLVTGSREDASAELAFLKLGPQKPAPETDEYLTVADALERWLSHVNAFVSKRTYERYAELARNTLSRVVGKAKLSSFTATQVRQALDHLASSGRRDGSGGLAPATILRAYRVLDQALNQAVRWSFLSENPVDTVEPPQAGQKPLTLNRVDEDLEMIRLARGSRIYIPMLLARMAGLRRGEISALRWKAVNLDLGRLAIYESVEQLNSSCNIKPLVDHRKRLIPVSAFLVQELRSHLRNQIGLGRIPGDDPTGGNQFVCTVRGGAMLRPTFLTLEWTKAARRLEIPGQTLHDLHHQHAMSLLAEGRSLLTVSERMGNSDVGTTARLYAHVAPATASPTATLLDAALSNLVQEL
jgi:integrase